MNVEKLGGKVLGEPVDIPGSAYMYTIHPTFLAFPIEKEKEERIKEFFSFFLV